ncbi:hypothetical protein KCP71_00510 [Salmonella enterica subsp. enterica]|nr:hypothetical protein KCP71_00510 [Salmonella enterica subsp. enterica]
MSVTAQRRDIRDPKPSSSLPKRCKPKHGCVFWFARDRRDICATNENLVE